MSLVAPLSCIFKDITATVPYLKFRHKDCHSIFASDRSNISSVTVVGTFLLATPPTHEYTSWVSMLGNTSIQFRVKACDSVYLALSELTGHTESLTYEIALGVGNDSEIRDAVNGKAKAKVFHPVLDCSEMKPFWITWLKGVIQVGRGATVGQNKLLIWQPRNPHQINAVSMATGGRGVRAWEFYTPVGK